jgi:hypothetical protein
MMNVFTSATAEYMLTPTFMLRDSVCDRAVELIKSRCMGFIRLITFPLPYLGVLSPLHGVSQNQVEEMASR